ncbi:hypothetical protein HDV00_010804 [Rhizophlyctis rosea]|nr:hypothetical protein HDV00_010804 [Rhizophlyctis rosea]
MPTDTLLDAAQRSLAFSRAVRQQSRANATRFQDAVKVFQSVNLGEEQSYVDESVIQSVGSLLDVAAGTVVDQLVLGEEERADVSGTRALPPCSAQSMWQSGMMYDSDILTTFSHPNNNQYASEFETALHLIRIGSHCGEKVASLLIPNVLPNLLKTLTTDSLPSAHAQMILETLTACCDSPAILRHITTPQLDLMASSPPSPGSLYQCYLDPLPVRMSGDNAGSLKRCEAVLGHLRRKVHCWEACVTVEETARSVWEVVRGGAREGGVAGTSSLASAAVLVAGRISADPTLGLNRESVADWSKVIKALDLIASSLCSPSTTSDPSQILPYISATRFLPSLTLLLAFLPVTSAHYEEVWKSVVRVVVVLLDDKDGLLFLCGEIDAEGGEGWWGVWKKLLGVQGGADCELGIGDLGGVVGREMGMEEDLKVGRWVDGWRRGVGESECAQHVLGVVTPEVLISLMESSFRVVGVVEEFVNAVGNGSRVSGERQRDVHNAVTRIATMLKGGSIMVYQAVISVLVSLDAVPHIFNLLADESPSSRLAVPLTEILSALLHSPSQRTLANLLHSTPLPTNSALQPIIRPLHLYTTTGITSLLKTFISPTTLTNPNFAYIAVALRTMLHALNVTETERKIVSAWLEENAFVGLEGGLAEEGVVSFLGRILRVCVDVSSSSELSADPAANDDALACIRTSLDILRNLLPIYDTSIPRNDRPPHPPTVQRISETLTPVLASPTEVFVRRKDVDVRVRPCGGALGGVLAVLVEVYVLLERGEGSGVGGEMVKMGVVDLLRRLASVICYEDGSVRPRFGPSVGVLIKHILETGVHVDCFGLGACLRLLGLVVPAAPTGGKEEEKGEEVVSDWDVVKGVWCRELGPLRRELVNVVRMGGRTVEKRVWQDVRALVGRLVGLDVDSDTSASLSAALTAMIVDEIRGLVSGYGTREGDQKNIEGKIRRWLVILGGVASSVSLGVWKTVVAQTGAAFYEVMLTILEAVEGVRREAFAVLLVASGKGISKEGCESILKIICGQVGRGGAAEEDKREGGEEFVSFLGDYLEVKGVSNVVGGMETANELFGQVWRRLVELLSTPFRGGTAEVVVGLLRVVSVVTRDGGLEKLMEAKEFDDVRRAVGEFVGRHDGTVGDGEKGELTGEMEGDAVPGKVVNAAQQGWTVLSRVKGVDEARDVGELTRKGTKRSLDDMLSSNVPVVAPHSTEDDMSPFFETQDSKVIYNELLHDILPAFDFYKRLKQSHPNLTPHDIHTLTVLDESPHPSPTTFTSPKRPTNPMQPLEVPPPDDIARLGRGRSESQQPQQPQYYRQYFKNEFRTTHVNRKANTSRPPSMHVDTYEAGDKLPTMEGGGDVVGEGPFEVGMQQEVQGRVRRVSGPEGGFGLFGKGVMGYGPPPPDMGPWWGMWPGQGMGMASASVGVSPPASGARAGGRGEWQQQPIGAGEMQGEGGEFTGGSGPYSGYGRWMTGEGGGWVNE